MYAGSIPTPASIFSFSKIPWHPVTSEIRPESGRSYAPSIHAPPSTQRGHFRIVRRGHYCFGPTLPGPVVVGAIAGECYHAVMRVAVNPPAAFLALDFETANRSRTSACALGLVAVRDGMVVATETFLIRPPRPHFEYTHIHRITWEDVRDAPTFAELWPRVASYMEAADFLVAHNAPFDRGVLERCCAHYGLALPRRRFFCTVQIARRQWGIHPTRLPDVCRRLGIALVHHEAGSDARACAEIALRAEREGWRPSLAAEGEKT